MSFSIEIKEEILKKFDTNKRKPIYFICGLLYSNREFIKNGVLVHSTDYIFIKTCNKLLSHYLKTQLNIVKKRNVYILYIEKPNIRESIYNEYINFLKNNKIFEEKSDNLASFICGCFIYCASGTDPNKDYHIDFSFNRQEDRDTLHLILNNYGIKSKQSLRGKKFTMYIKESEDIEDLLTLMGATKTSISLMNVKIFKGLRNKVNRITNCETANLDKTVNASAKQLEDIKLLINNGLLKKLDDKLLKTVNLRLNHPELSLDELAMLDGSISKSGLNHRLKKIREIAKEYK